MNSSALRPCEPARASVPKTILRPENLSSTPNYIVVELSRLRHRGKTFFSVSLCSNELVFVRHIILNNESGLWIEVGSVLS